MVDDEELVATIAGKLSERAAQEGLIQPSASTLIDFMDYGDSVPILNRHRDLLPKPIAAAIRELTPIFETTVQIRNRVVHGRPLRTDDQSSLIRLVERLVDSPVPAQDTKEVLLRLEEDPAWSPLVEIDTKAGSRVLHNLPLPETDETGLLGREDEVAKLRTYLLNPRIPVITVAGEGGVGKTALVVNTLYELIDSPDCPFGVVLWSSLKSERLTGRGVETITDAARNLIGVAHQLAAAVDESLEVGELSDLRPLADLLEGVESLIVVDNVESITGPECIELIDALPTAKFVFTTRVGIGELERKLPVGSLGVGSAKHMLRVLAQTRSLLHLQRLDDGRMQDLVEKLGLRPLAIRWFVEAVAAGGQPDDLVRDQSAVLRFCLGKIYDGLDQSLRRTLVCLLELDRPATLAEMAILTEADRASAQDAMLELQRRSLVVIEPGLTDSMAQAYELGSMAREYLLNQAPVDAHFQADLRRRIAEIQAHEDIRQRQERDIVLKPTAVFATSLEERAAATLLRQSLRSYRSDLEAAREQVDRAKDAAPHFFESYRVSAFIESSNRPEEATRQYEVAYRLAPSEQKPRVAYWYAGHIARPGGDLDLALQLAREAHNGLGTVDTALRLGHVLRYRGEFGEARELYLAAAEETELASGKSRVIAEAVLLDLAKREVEALTDDRQPLAAVRVGADALERGWDVMRLQLVDARFDERVARLVGETLRAVILLPDCEQAREHVDGLLEGIDRHVQRLARGALRDEWVDRLTRLKAQDTTPEEIALFIDKIHSRLDFQQLKRGNALDGAVLSWDRLRGYGFVQSPQLAENLFFHRDDVASIEDCLLLQRETPVSFRVDTRMHSGELRDRATAVEVRVAPEERAQRLSKRSGEVVRRESTYLIVRDDTSGNTLLAHKGALGIPQEWELVRIGDRLVFDAEVREGRASAARGSVFRERDV